MAIALEKDNQILVVENGPVFTRDKTGRFIIDKPFLKKQKFFKPNKDFRRTKFEIMNGDGDSQLIFKEDFVSLESDAELYYAQLLTHAKGKIKPNVIFPAISEKGKKGELVEHFFADKNVTCERNVLYMQDYDDITYKSANQMESVIRDFFAKREQFFVEEDLQDKFLQLAIADYAVCFSDRRTTNVSILIKEMCDKNIVEMSPIYDNGFILGLGTTWMQTGYKQYGPKISELCHEYLDNRKESKYIELLKLIDFDLMGISKPLLTKNFYDDYDMHMVNEQELASHLKNDTCALDYFRRLTNLKFTDMSNICDAENPGFEYDSYIKNADMVMAVKQDRMETLMEKEA